MKNAITSLLSLTESEKQSKGITDTPREIFQQPDTWRVTGQQLASERASTLRFLETVGIATRGLQEKPSVILAGAGTSDYIGQAVSRALRKEWACEVTAVPSTELLTNMDDYVLPGKKYLMISFSRSGDSSEGIATLEQATERFPDQIHHLVITCNALGSMAKFQGAHAVVLDDRVNDRGLAMTSSFTNMVIVGQYLANIFHPGRYEQKLLGMIDTASHLIPKAADLASDLSTKDYSRMCFIGAGALNAVAKESSLKVLELNAGKIATLAESPLGLRHGPLSFVNDETLLVAYLSSDEQRRCYELDLLEEIARKGLTSDIVIVAPHHTRRMEDLTRNILTLNSPVDVPDTYRPPIDIIVGQMIGLFTSLSNHIQPDSPGTGAISRVVSKVKIYPSAAR